MCEKKREEFFKVYEIECTCRPGFVVCANCIRYYEIFGKLSLRLEYTYKRWSNRFWDSFWGFLER